MRHGEAFRFFLPNLIRTIVLCYNIRYVTFLFHMVFIQIFCCVPLINIEFVPRSSCSVFFGLVEREIYNDTVRQKFNKRKMESLDHPLNKYLYDTILYICRKTQSDISKRSNLAIILGIAIMIPARYSKNI